MRLIDADALKEMCVYASPCTSWEQDSKLIDLIDAQPTIAAPRWVRCEDEMPENAKHKGAFCPRLHVLTKWGVTDGWFNPDVGEDGLWCVLLWFFQGTYKEDDVDLERGDKPRTSWVSKDNVYAWMPIEPPKERE